MKVYLYTTKGLGKAESEDRVLVGHRVFSETETSEELDSGYVAIADGVGGNLGGAVAAQFVCEQIAELVFPSIEQLATINEALVEKSNSYSLLHGMATTMSGLFFDKSGLASIFHVGNTRVYAIQAGQYLNQLTQDDTVVAYLVRTGKLTEEEALHYPAKNEITSCFGGGKTDFFKATVFPLDCDSHRQLLLTCDGIHDVLSVDEIEDVVASSEEDWENAVNRLVLTAKENGSTDDCTAVIINMDA